MHIELHRKIGRSVSECCECCFFVEVALPYTVCSACCVVLLLSYVQRLLCGFAPLLFATLAVWFCFYVMYSRLMRALPLSCLQDLPCGCAPKQKHTASAVNRTGAKLHSKLCKQEMGNATQQPLYIRKMQQNHAASVVKRRRALPYSKRCKQDRGNATGKGCKQDRGGATQLMLGQGQCRTASAVHGVGTKPHSKRCNQDRGSATKQPLRMR